MNVTEIRSEEQVTAAAEMRFDALESVAELYTTGVDRIADAQKKALDSAIGHNAEIVNAWKRQGSAVPGVFMFDLATIIFDRFAETQKGAIDLLVEQSHTLAGLVKEHKGKPTQAMKETVAKAQEAIDNTVAAQKAVLDYSAKQTKTAFETAKKQLGYAGTPAAAAADSVERGIEVIVDAQKDLVDVMKTPIQILH